LCVVGDDDQSIYKWRGADVRNIRGFRHDYPDAHIVKLEENYRSTKNIVAAALGVIKPSREREPKELFTNNDIGAPVSILATYNERDEAAQVVRMIREAEGTGISRRDIAVLYRVHAQSRVLEEALRAESVQYQIVGGMKFYERAEVKDALSYLRVLQNPKSDVDFLRVANVPPRGIGQVTLDRLSAFALERRIALMEALEFIEEAKDVSQAVRKKLTQLRDLLSQLRAQVDRDSPDELLESVLTKSGYFAMLTEENTAESDAREENLRELGGSMQDYTLEAEARGEQASLAGFLERVSLVSDTDNVQEQERVTLMTVHGAKGLEFELVILTGMEEDMFPYRSMDESRDDDIEEERRLGYVAITRAKKHLVLTHTRVRQIFGNTRPGRPSRFVLDMPQDVLSFHATPDVRAAGEARFVDRAWEPPRNRPPDGGRWRHPQDAGEGAAYNGRASRGAPEPRRDPGERYIEHDMYDGREGHDLDEAPRRGQKVHHAQFGEGSVVSVTQVGHEPAIVAFFPGWGERKVLAKFLKLR
jgi:DNA helicase-2/ATP-dependent DNA helicase PcrA